MLVLKRRAGEKLIINDNISILICGVIGNQVKFGLEAPENVCILREELLKKRTGDFDFLEEIQQEEQILLCQLQQEMSK